MRRNRLITRFVEWVRSPRGGRSHRQEADAGTGNDARKPTDDDGAGDLPQLDSSEAGTLPSAAIF